MLIVGRVDLLRAKSPTSSHLRLLAPVSTLQFFGTQNRVLPIPTQKYLRSRAVNGHSLASGNFLVISQFSAAAVKQKFD